MNLIPWKSERRELAPREPMAPWTAGTALTTFRDEMDRLFDRFFRDPWGTGERGWMPPAEWLPAVDVAEKDKEIVIRADIPGFDAKDLEITASGNMLSISGQTSESSERRDEDVYHRERRFGSFRRDIELPSYADVDRIDAEHKNGVLTIHVKKVAGAEPRRVTVTKGRKEEVSVPVTSGPRR